MTEPIDKDTAKRCPLLLAFLLILIAAVCTFWIMSPIPKDSERLPSPVTAGEKIADVLAHVAVRGMPAMMLLGCAGMIGGSKSGWIMLQVGLGLLLLLGIWVTAAEMFGSRPMRDPVSAALGVTVAVICPLTALCYLRFSGAVRRYAQRRS